MSEMRSRILPYGWLTPALALLALALLLLCAPVAEHWWALLLLLLGGGLASWLQWQHWQRQQVQAHAEVQALRQQLQELRQPAAFLHSLEAVVDGAVPRWSHHIDIVREQTEEAIAALTSRFHGIIERLNHSLGLAPWQRRYQHFDKLRQPLSAALGLALRFFDIDRGRLPICARTGVPALAGDNRPSLRRAPAAFIRGMNLSW